jgi:hypothetical protein
MALLSLNRSLKQKGRCLGIGLLSSLSAMLASLTLLTLGNADASIAFLSLNRSLRESPSELGLSSRCSIGSHLGSVGYRLPRTRLGNAQMNLALLSLLPRFVRARH